MEGRIVRFDTQASLKHLDEPSQTAQREFRFDSTAAAEELVVAGFPEPLADTTGRQAAGRHVGLHAVSRSRA